MDSSRSRALAWALAAICASLIAVFAGLFASGVLRFTSPPPGPAVRSRALVADSGLRAPARLPEATVRAPAEQTQMPPDVRAWLEHLARIEKKKNALHEDMANEAKIMEKMLSGLGGIENLDVATILDPQAGMPDPRQNVAKMFREMAQPWRDLRAEFVNTGPPVPAECKPLANAFESGLAAIPEQIELLEQTLGGFDPAEPEVRKAAKGATDSARKVGKENKRSIDASFASADVLLGSIFRKYDTPKWFDIQTGTLSGSAFAR